MAFHFWLIRFVDGSLFFPSFFYLLWSTFDMGLVVYINYTYRNFGNLCFVSIFSECMFECTLHFWILLSLTLIYNKINSYQSSKFLFFSPFRMLLFSLLEWRWNCFSCSYYPVVRFLLLWIWFESFAFLISTSLLHSFH